MCPMHPQKRKRKVFMLLAFPVMVFGLGAAIMYLWNWLMPDLFGLNAISYWQALGLFALSRLLLGGFRFGKHKHHGHKDFV